MLRSQMLEILKRSVLLASVCAASLSAGSASATLALNQGAALVAVPILVNAFGTHSYATITNASDQNVTLHLEFLDGTPASPNKWNGQDYSCPVTAQETVLFVFRPTMAGPGPAAVDFKCSLAVPTPNGVIVASTPQTIDLPFSFGLMTVAVESPAGTTVSSNILFGDWLSVNFANADAFGAGAITLQGLSALAQDGDRNYRFDGKEYSTFPAQLASNFIAPIVTLAGPYQISASLILFTLDGTVNGQPAAPNGQVNPVQLRGNVYNDREESQSFNFNFDCITIVEDLDGLTPAFLNTGAGGFMTPTGHFDLTPVATGAGDPAHEFEFGNGNSVRKRPVAGWLIETLRGGASIPNVGANPSPPFPAARLGSFARTLGSSVTSFTPLTGDTPTFSSN